MSNIEQQALYNNSESKIIKKDILKPMNIDNLKLAQTEKKTINQSITLTNKTNKTEYKFPLKTKIEPKSLNFIGKKRILTSEERLLEKIRIEKEQIEREKRENWSLYERSKHYKPMMHLQPSPLTLLKPFKLSTNYSTIYLKKRQSTTNYETNKINEKIIKKLKDKCDKYNSEIQNENNKKINNINNQKILTNNTILSKNESSKENINTENILNNNINDICVYDTAVKKMKEDIDNNYSNMSLSQKISKYCEIDQMLLMKQNLCEKMENNN